MKTEFRTRLLASSLLIGAAAMAQPAFAQAEDDVQLGDASTTGAPIIVTGTRIPQPTIESTSPLQVVDAQQIDDSGATNIQELLLENPAFGTPALSRTNSAFTTTGAGVATVDLRDLGSDRTLVLINGRRVVAGLPGSSIVDLNTIPQQFIERIDVLTGGASSLYGSDAVAGVVNFIYREDFNGIEAEAQYGISEEGDDGTYQGSVTLGSDFADGRGNIMVHFGYTNQTGVRSRDRQATFTDDISDVYFTGYDGYFTEHEPYFSSFPPQGRFGTDNFNWTYDQQTGELKPCFSTNGTNPNCGSGTPDGFNRQFYRTIAVPVERMLFAARANYEITDGIEAILEATYNNTYASTEIEPFALSSSNIYPASGGLYPIDTYVQTAPGVFTPVQNPFVPGPIAADAVDNDGDGLRDITFARRLLEFGTRNYTADRDYFRIVGGLRGTLWDDSWSWDVTYNYGQVNESQRGNGQVNVLNFRNALTAIPDTMDINNNGSTTDAICADADARAQGCVPVNVFGLGSISPAAIAYIQAPGSHTFRTRQQVVNANLAGSLFELPAGPVGLAVGAEYRREDSRENFDALTNAGLNAGNAQPDTEGGFDVVEGYLEVQIPLLADTPFFHQLDIRGAVRVSDYSTVGTVWSYNGGVDWAPIEDVRFRGTYARSVRAPNISELFTAPSQTFPPGLQDPCIGIMATGGGTTGDQCRAAPGVLLNISQNGGVFTRNQADLQGVSGFNSGNPNLGEETSTSWTVGVVINPVSVPSLRNFVLTVDYYNIQVDDVITLPPRAFILDQCYNQGDNSFCQFVTRRPTATAVNNPGSISFINALNFNGGVLQAEGVDVTASYRTPLRLFGDGTLSARIAYTHVIEGYLIPVPGAPLDRFAGEIGTSRDRFTANLNYRTGMFGITFTGTYIGSAYEDDQFLSPDPIDSVIIPSEFYLDSQIKFSPSDSFEIYFGVNNLLDNTAPAILTQTPFNTTGHDTAADVYDDIGRRYYTGVRLRF